MCRYNETEDEVLIQRLRAGESMIADYLMEKYKGLVRKKARAMFLIGGDTDDLIQEGMIGCLKQSGITSLTGNHPFSLLRICVLTDRSTVRLKVRTVRNTSR